MTYIKINDQFATPFFHDEQLTTLEKRIHAAHEQLHLKKGAGNNFLGWLDLPETYDKDEFERIKVVAEEIKANTDIFLVIGVGGSYLGARAAIELLNHSFQNQLPREKRNGPLVLFVGHQLSGTYLRDLFDILDGKDIILNVISKSGTTMESAIAFRIFKKYMVEKYGEKIARERIYVTTDKSEGALKAIATKEQFGTFVIPHAVGGRYSVLTAVGLLPIAVSGIAIDDIMIGARQAMIELETKTVQQNPAYLYAALRHIFYQNGKLTELLVSYEPQFHYFQEWWKQLFGESEGKDGKGLFPASVSYSTDLHSFGQYIQDGERYLFQTVLHVNEPKRDFRVPEDGENIDGLNYLAGKTMNEINNKAFEGALLAHTDGNVPNIVLEIPRIDAFSFGYLVYFFEKACAISGYLLNVNPFDQPGVEAYKKNMLKLLGK